MKTLTEEKLTEIRTLANEVTATMARTQKAQAAYRLAIVNAVIEVGEIADVSSLCLECGTVYPTPVGRCPKCSEDPS